MSDDPTYRFTLNVTKSLSRQELVWLLNRLAIHVRQDRPLPGAPRSVSDSRGAPVGEFHLLDGDIPPDAVAILDESRGPWPE